MNYEIKGEPMPVVLCDLNAGETMITEKGSMVWMSPNMEMQTSAGGSLGKAFGRMFSGESMFQNLYTAKGGIDMGEHFQDCGLLLYDREKQDMHAGGSGCGCSASVLNGYLLSGMRQGKWKKIVFAPTGALLSPTSSFQGESIPSICHALCISTTK